MYYFYLILYLIALPLFGFDLSCQRPDLALSSGPWEQSPDFMTLHFTGKRAQKEFDGIGSPDTELYSVILRSEWCRSLEAAILCETPLSALVEMETSTSGTGPIIKTPLRYFITIVNYRNDGYAFLKVRAQRMDSNPPITFHTEFPVGSCSIHT